jgi:hypothetical protein
VDVKRREESHVFGSKTKTNRKRACKYVCVTCAEATLVNDDADHLEDNGCDG